MESLNLSAPAATAATTAPPAISPERYAEIEAEERARAEIRSRLAPRRVKSWQPGTSAALSFLIPGLGQIYKGQVLDGIAYFFCTCIGIAFGVFPGIFIWLWGIYNAYCFDPSKPSISGARIGYGVAIGMFIVLVVAAMIAGS